MNWTEIMTSAISTWNQQRTFPKNAKTRKEDESGSQLAMARRELNQFVASPSAFARALNQGISEKSLGNWLTGSSTIQKSKRHIIIGWLERTTPDSRKAAIISPQNPEVVRDVMWRMVTENVDFMTMKQVYIEAMLFFGYENATLDSKLDTLLSNLNRPRPNALPADPAPPGLHSPAPPGLHSPAPPGLHSPAPPGLHSPAPPGLHSPAPPGLHSPAPPGQHAHTALLDQHDPAFLDFPVPSPPRAPVVVNPSARTPPLVSSQLFQVSSDSTAVCTTTSTVTASLSSFVPEPVAKSTTPSSLPVDTLIPVTPLPLCSCARCGHSHSDLAVPDPVAMSTTASPSTPSGLPSPTTSETSCSSTQSSSMSSIALLLDTPKVTTPKFSPTPALATPEALTSTTTASSGTAATTMFQELAPCDLSNPRKCESNSEVHDEIRMIEKELDGLKEERSFIERVGKYGIEHAKRTDPEMVTVMEEDKLTKTIRIDEKISSIVSLLAEKKFQLDRS